jgi:predicted transcriptional regulator
MSEGRVLRGEPEGGKRSGVIPYKDPETRTRFTRVWYFVDLDRENEMPDAPPSPTLDTKLTTNIVAAYVRRNQIGADQLPIVISTVHQALAGLGESKAETEIERTPAVSIRQSVHRDYVVCLDCGWRGQMLKRHLATGHGLSVDQYRARWNLSREHPITAPGYSEQRSGLAKQIGLGRGRGRRASREEPGRSHPEFRQRNNRDLDGEVGRDQGLLRACSAYPPTSGAPGARESGDGRFWPVACGHEQEVALNHLSQPRRRALMHDVPSAGRVGGPETNASRRCARGSRLRATTGPESLGSRHRSDFLTGSTSFSKGRFSTTPRTPRRQSVLHGPRRLRLTAALKIDDAVVMCGLEDRSGRVDALEDRGQSPSHRLGAKPRDQLCGAGNIGLIGALDRLTPGLTRPRLREAGFGEVGFRLCLGHRLGPRLKPVRHRSILWAAMRQED